MSDAFVYRDLETWQQAMALIEECYRLTTSFPKSEQYGLTSQMRRAACIDPVECCGRTLPPVHEGFRESRRHRVGIAR
jgi:hypothetical protein